MFHYEIKPTRVNEVMCIYDIYIIIISHNFLRNLWCNFHTYD